MVKLAHKNGVLVEPKKEPTKYVSKSIDKDFITFYETLEEHQAYLSKLDPPKQYPEEDIKEVYRKHKANGKSYFETIRAKLVLDYKSGKLKDSEVFEIESKLFSVTERIKSGDWKTALNELSKVTVEGALSQVLYDEINTYINDYITNHY